MTERRNELSLKKLAATLMSWDIWNETGGVVKPVDVLGKAGIYAVIQYMSARYIHYESRRHTQAQ